MYYTVNTKRGGNYEYKNEIKKKEEEEENENV